MSAQTKKSLGTAIDAVVDALENLDEPSKVIAVKAACEHLNIPLDFAQTSAQTPPRPGAMGPTPVGPSPEICGDIRSLKESKEPRNDIEMACVVAYYLKNSAPAAERKPEIVAEDIEKYFTQAGYPLPKVPKQVLPNAKAAGYLDSVGRGKYRLNPVGHNLVAHSLPRKKGKKS